MAKAFGILFVVVFLWVGLEVYTEGAHGAFGGRFSELLSDPPKEIDDRSAAQRAGGAVDKAHRQSEERRERLLAE